MRLQGTVQLCAPVHCAPFMHMGMHQKADNHMRAGGLYLSGDLL